MIKLHISFLAHGPTTDSFPTTFSEIGLQNESKSNKMYVHTSANSDKALCTAKSDWFSIFLK
jgi:D-tyrosyl-tRNA(Tyr) deacylase